MIKERRGGKKNNISKWSKKQDDIPTENSLLSIVLFSERKTWQNFSIVLQVDVCKDSALFTCTRLVFTPSTTSSTQSYSSFTRRHRPFSRRCLRSLLSSWKTMHDGDFAYQSKWEFYSVNLFRSRWKEVETKFDSLPSWMHCLSNNQ